MAVRLTQASVLSGINSAATNNKLDSTYTRVNAGYIPTLNGSVVAYTSSQTWTRPSNVHFIDIALVGGGGGGACGAGARQGGGGSGGAVIQFNQFYVGDYDTWYIIIAGNSPGCPAGNQSTCCCNSFGQSGNPTIFSPISSSFTMSALTGVDNSNLRRTLIAPGGGGGGHPCGSPGNWSLVSEGGHGSNENTSVMWGVARNSYSPTRIIYQGYGGRGGVSGAGTGGVGGNGGGAGGSGGTGSGGVGKSLMSPFSGSYGGGGAGGNGSSPGSGGGGTGTTGTANTGGGGGGSINSGNGGLGGTGRIEIRTYFSS